YHEGQGPRVGRSGQQLVERGLETAGGESRHVPILPGPKVVRPPCFARWRPRLRPVRTPWRPFDWNVRHCGWHGHVTWAPTEEDLAARLGAETVQGEAWRCLRCGSYVIGPPQGRGPADRAPIVLRGRALRDAFILRLLAVERGI